MLAMAEEVKDQEFVEYVVKAIVDNPGDVKTERTVDEMGTLVSLHVNAEDMGTIIGKEGRTAKALRTLLRVLGAKNNARVNLKIIEPEGGRGMYTPPQDGNDSTLVVEEAPPEKSSKKEKEAAPAAEPETGAAPEDDMPAVDGVKEALSDLPQDELA